jgi:hypothetical protein
MGNGAFAVKFAAADCRYPGRLVRCGKTWKNRYPLFNGSMAAGHTIKLAQKPTLFSTEFGRLCSDCGDAH